MGHFEILKFALARGGDYLGIMTEETKIRYDTCGMKGETAWAVTSLDSTKDFANGVEPTFKRAQVAASHAQSDHYMKLRRSK